MKTRRARAAILGLTAVLYALTPAYAETDAPASDTEQLVLADATPLSGDEMSDLRGGFADPSGLLFNFSVNVQTALDGLQVFTRSLTVAPSTINGQLQATLDSRLMPQNIPAGLSVNVAGNGSGLTVTDPNGNVTTVMNQTASGVPSSIILNTANNRNITQSVSVNLTLQNAASIMNFVHTTTQGAALAQHNAIRSLGF